MQNTARKIANFKIDLPSQKIQYRLPVAVNENDDLYQDLEKRYGSAFAQGIVDGMKTAG